VADDGQVKIDTDLIRDCANQLYALGDEARSLVASLYAVPDPTRSCGSGVDSMSRQFLTDYAKLGGPQVVPGFEELGTGLDGYAENLNNLATQFDQADDAATLIAQGANGVIASG
jgi:hypothetical protein